MKKLKKIINCIVLALIAFCIVAAFVSCDNNVKDIETNFVYSNYVPQLLSDDMKSEIQNAYFAKTYEEGSKDYYNSPDQVHVEYYGSFNNAYCVMITCPLYEYPQNSRPYVRVR